MVVLLQHNRELFQEGLMYFYVELLMEIKGQVTSQRNGLKNSGNKGGWITMICSPDINQVIRKSLSPILKENGFNKVNTRNNWRWIDQCIWVFRNPCRW